MVAERPKILRRLMAQLMDTGISVDKAGAIATKKLQQQGILKPGSMELTEYGVQRDEMSAGDRAIDRQSRRTGRGAQDYEYSPDTNRATVKRTARKGNPYSF